MKIEKFVTGIISTNCYLVINEETKHAVIVDLAAFPRALKNYIEEENITVEAILLTHAHFDHIMGIDDFKKVYDVPVYVEEHDADLLTDAEPVIDLYQWLYICRSEDCEGRRRSYICRI